ncbi:MAG: AMP-binding protein [candidate division Zixibacteria bacterium]|nr:AMP-binding protein [candidate division Zixibacteria bacterium]
MPPRYIHELLLASAEKYPYRPAFWLREGERFLSLNYRDLAARVLDVAAGFQQLGLKAGDRAGIYAPNSPEWGIAYLAILAAGGVVVPLDVQLKLFELRSIIAKANLKFLFCAESSQPELAELKALVAPHPEIISLEGNDYSTLSLARLEKLGRQAEFEPAEVDPQKMAVLLFTSGTSGEAKGVMLSHVNIVADVEASARYLPLTSDDRALSVLPLHHTFEATAGFLYPLSVGASIGYASSLKSTQIAADIKTLGITIMCGVPLLYEKMYLRLKRALADASRLKRVYVNLGLKVSALLRRLFRMSAGRAIFKPLRAKAGLATIRMFVSGGAAMNPEISRFFCDLGIDLVQGYGLTETAPVLTVNTIRKNRYASVGRPLPGVEVRIIDPDAGGIGEIAVKGDMVMIGYYENEAATAEVMQEGFFFTGDLGYLDDDGYLYITGRKKNVIISPAGKNIYPEEIEAALDNSPYILESAVLSRPRGSGEEPIAVVVPDYEIINAGDRHLTDNEIEKIVRSEVERIGKQMAEFKRIRDVVIYSGELPKTSTRKVKKYILIDMLRKKGEL